MGRGVFITFEGPEGSGKSTHARLLCAFLRGRGFRVLHVREPGATSIGEKIRRILLDPRNKGMSALCEMLLYQACRCQVVKEKILPALKDGRVVVCDRFLDATVAYQGYGGGIDIGLIKKIADFVNSGVSPELTLFLDISTAKGLKRSGMKDRIEKKPISYHYRVRQGYLKLAKGQPHRIRVIPVAEKIDQTQQLIRKAVLNVLC